MILYIFHIFHIYTIYIYNQEIVKRFSFNLVFREVHYLFTVNGQMKIDIHIV